MLVVGVLAHRGYLHADGQHISYSKFGQDGRGRWVKLHLYCIGAPKASFGAGRNLTTASPQAGRAACLPSTYTVEMKLAFISIVPLHPILSLYPIVPLSSIILPLPNHPAFISIISLSFNPLAPVSLVSEKYVSVLEKRESSPLAHIVGVSKLTFDDG